MDDVVAEYISNVCRHQVSRDRTRTEITESMERQRREQYYSLELIKEMAEKDVWVTCVTVSRVSLIVSQYSLNRRGRRCRVPVQSESET